VRAHHDLVTSVLVYFLTFSGDLSPFIDQSDSRSGTLVEYHIALSGSSVNALSVLVLFARAVTEYLLSLVYSTTNDLARAHSIELII